MLISELISELQAVVDHRGDREVRIICESNEIDMDLYIAMVDPLGNLEVDGSFDERIEEIRESHSKDFLRVSDQHNEAAKIANKYMAAYKELKAVVEQSKKSATLIPIPKKRRKAKPKAKKKIEKVTTD